ncbi:MAG: RNA polymerase sigma factor [Saprospiraceae bacterium]|jgi:RNA polymerase sigma-70 factor (ECF subfamily)|nr:RNA polymerase sigma factor [Saprospiraceae bacterium]
MDIREYKTTILPIKNKLYRFTLGIIKDAAEAQDVVQEVLIKVWNKRDELDHINNIEAWCMRLTKNLAIDKLRSKHRRTEDIETTYSLSSNESTPFEQTAVKDSVSKIKNMIADLPQKQKEVILLRDIEGFSYQEISDTLNMSLAQVKTNLFRARQRIKALFLKTESYGL